MPFKRDISEELSTAPKVSSKDHVPGESHVLKDHLCQSLPEEGSAESPEITFKFSGTQ